MHFRIGALLLLSLLGSLATTQGAARKDDKASISFHLQAQGIDNPKMIFPLSVHGQELYFRRMPEFTTKDIVGFKSFPSDQDDLLYGLALRLKPHASRRLMGITNANQGKWLTALVNGRPVDTVLIDGQVNDGILVIWKNVTLADIATIENALPRPKKPKAKE